MNGATQNQVVLDTPGIIIGAINVTAAGASPATVNNNASIGSSGTGHLIDFYTADVLTFTGIGAIASQNGFDANINDYSGLGPTNFYTNLSALTIIPNGGGTITIPNTIANIASPTSHVTVTTQGNVTFNSNIGAMELHYRQ
ncbi:MAG: hypothetical protein RCG15_03020 [Candidatus Rickettsia vulgarisii]